MTLTWHCLTKGCDAGGDTNVGAEKHTKTTQHGTSTVVVP